MFWLTTDGTVSRLNKNGGEAYLIVEYMYSFPGTKFLTGRVDVKESWKKIPFRNGYLCLNQVR